MELSFSKGQLQITIHNNKLLMHHEKHGEWVVLPWEEVYTTIREYCNQGTIKGESNEL